jgi:hypothetical protein
MLVIRKLRERVTIEFREGNSQRAIALDAQRPMVPIQARRNEGQYLPPRQSPVARMDHEVAHPSCFDIHDHAVEGADLLSGLPADIDAVKTRAIALHVMGVDVVEP